MSHIRHLLALAAVALLAGPFAWAQPSAPASHDQHHGSSTAAAPAAAPEMAQGEVRKVDREAGKVTLRHGPIRNLDMPPMTMVFKASDPRLLDRIKPGDTIRFVAGREGGGFTVDAIEVAP